VRWLSARSMRSRRGRDPNTQSRALSGGGPRFRPGIVLETISNLKLTLVPPLPPVEVPEGDPFATCRRADPCRPVDHLEPWRVASVPCVQAVARAAAARGLHLDTAIALLCELRFSLEDLDELRVAVDQLDEAAARSRIDVALPAADASYLRALLNGAKLSPEPSLPAHRTVGLPARLSARLARTHGPVPLLTADDLDRAVAWEAAAVTEGRTLGEWAAWQAARLAEATRSARS
jgi:hypothetical protein